jgi:hypothetical protein
MPNEKYFTYREDDNHYTVVDAEDTTLGSVTETEGGWRAYNIDGSELPGAEVYVSQHDAGEALAAQFEGGNNEGS